MHGLALLLGHLLGDYVFQRDWEARLKTCQPPKGPRPPWPSEGLLVDVNAAAAAGEYDKAVHDAKWAPWACTWHCLGYTLACFFTCFWFLPWWAYPVIFLAHYPVDRWRLARKIMDFNGQEAFATGIFAPWSVTVVDNCLHLLVLYIIGMLTVV